MGADLVLGRLHLNRPIYTKRQPEACLCRLQGLGKLKVVFDLEKIKTECHMFARHIGSVIYIVEVRGYVPSHIGHSLP